MERATGEIKTNFKIKDFDPKNEKPVNIKDVFNNRKTSMVSFFKKNKIHVGSSKLKTSYLLFALQDVSEKHNLRYEEILTFLYLEELGLFGISVDVLGRQYRLGNYLRTEHIIEDYSHKRKKLYRLTDKAKAIVIEFNNGFQNNDSFVSKNRKTDIDLDNRVSGVLDNYFKSSAL